MELKDSQKNLEEIIRNSNDPHHKSFHKNKASVVNQDAGYTRLQIKREESNNNKSRITKFDENGH